MGTDDEANGAEAYLYHYCSGISARCILDEAPPYFLVGTGDYGTGVYATDIAPEDAGTLQCVSAECFDGAAQPPEIDHVFVLHRGNSEYEFEEQAAHQWLMRSTDLAIDIDTVVVELCRLDGDRWVTVASWDGWEWQAGP